MKSRLGLSIFLPLLVLVLAASVACSQDREATPAARGLIPTVSPVEPARPLTADERAAISEFASQRQTIDGEREQFYQEFGQWRADLTACHPSVAHEALREFATSFAVISENARNLPRTSSTKEIADLLISAAIAEEAAFRQLRDRWQPGNIVLLEAVELKRAEAGNAQSAVADLSLLLEEKFEDGPTADEVEEMEEFSDNFGEIADSWDDIHDDYAALVKRERRLKDAAIVAGYEQLIEQFKEIVSVINELTSTEVNEELIETLQDAAEAELATLEYLLESLTEAMSEPSDIPASKDASTPLSTPDIAVQVSFPAQSPEPPEEPATEPTTEPTQEAPAAPPEPAPPTPEPTKAPAAVSETSEEMGPSPEDELAEAVEQSESALAEVEQSIEEIVNDKSVENLEDFKDFNGEYLRFVDERNQFYEGFTDWRATDGGCDQVRVTQELTRFSRQAGELARKARDLPQSGYLVPVYALMVDASEREEGAFRTLANSWTPFATDVFKAVDEERVSANRLRQQANIALEELRSRP